MNNSHNIKAERREKERQDRKKSILKAAREIFFRKGFMDSTVEEIAAKCGLAKGTIYLYFKSKEDIYVSIMAEGLNLLKKDMEKVSGLDLRSDRLIGVLVHGYYDFYKRNKKYFRMMFLSSQPDVRSSVSEGLLNNSIAVGNDCIQIVSDVIKKGVADGLFRKVDHWAAANILWAMVNGIIMSYEEDPIYRDEIVGIGLKEILNESIDLVLNGLRVKNNALACN